jgi:hypothetical protein
MRRCKCLRLQPWSMKSRASQSSSSGCVGGSPWAPKSLGVRTIPWPKCQAQTRLTRTRAVSGLSRAVNHFARAARRLAAGTPAKFGLPPEIRRAAGKAGSITSRGLPSSPRCRRWTVRAWPGGTGGSPPALRSGPLGAANPIPEVLGTANITVNGTVISPATFQTSLSVYLCPSDQSGTLNPYYGSTSGATAFPSSRAASWVPATGRRGGNAWRPGQPAAVSALGGGSRCPLFDPSGDPGCPGGVALT